MTTTTTQRQCSVERGCRNKIWISRKNYRSDANRMAKKHGKQYGVYECPHCKRLHLTTKVDLDGQWTTPLIYITPNTENS